MESCGRAILPLMGRENPPRSSIAPSEVTVTITVRPPAREGSLRQRLAAISRRRRGRGALGVALAVAALGAIIATGVQSGRTSRAGAGRAQVRDAERAAIAAAFGYPYPRRCLTITISTSNPDYARADVGRAKGCRRYYGYVNASFHRVAGAWRLLRDEGQLYVPNSLLRPCRGGQAGCARGRTSGWQAAAAAR